MRWKEISIDEIEEIPQSDNLDNSRLTTLNSISSHNKEAEYMGYDILFSERGHDAMYVLHDPKNKDNISLLQLDVSTNPYPAINATQTKESYRGTGKMKTLLKYVIDQYGGVMSDNKQSPDAKGFWQSIIKNTMGFHLFVIDKSGKEFPINSIDPWSQSDLRIVIHD